MERNMKSNYENGVPFLLFLIISFATGLKMICISLIVLNKENTCEYNGIFTLIGVIIMSFITIYILHNLFAFIFSYKRMCQNEIINNFISFIYILCVVYLSVMLEMCRNDYHILAVVSDIFHYVFIIMYQFYVFYNESKIYDENETNNINNEINNESENENILNHETINVDENETLLTINITENDNVIPNNSLKIDIIKFSN